MKPILTPIYLFSFLIFVTVLLTGQSTTIYTPTDDISLNCGSSGDMVSDIDTQTWSGDISSKLSPVEVGRKSQVLKAPSPSSTGEVPYTTARLSYSEFSYSFPVSPGQKFIRLYFFPATYNADFERSKSLFSVEAGGYTFLKDFNASVSADADYFRKMVREFCINVEAEQHSLDIKFSPSMDGYAFINGIEIMSMPTDLYYSSAQGDGVPTIGAESSSYINNATALEMVYRINVGGSPVSPSQDTGMYRTWDSADDLYLDEVSISLGSATPNSRTHLNFSMISEYVAPEEVYRTARTMGYNKTINKSYNLTWGFPVHPLFYYLVRLHFCEFEPEITLSRQRMFQIFIANQTAEPEADVILWSRGNGIPIYRDYLVYAPSLPNKKKVDIFVALQANPMDVTSAYNNVILNGLEIFKLNDTDGNLAGPNPDPLPEKKPNVNTEIHRELKKKAIPMYAILAGVVSVFLVLSVVGFSLFRRRRKVKDSNPSEATKWGPYSFSTTKSTKSLGSSLPTDLCRYFSLAEIKAATQNFNEVFIIGYGGFGNVYKGYIDDGSIPVAIKRLKPESSQGAHEFKTEIEMLSQLRHLHLVSLVGYCTEQGEMILVYDYMAGGTLRDHLYKTENPPLPWEQRLQICIGAARGLHYLHTGAKCMIIHRDVKSTNILLDEKWVAKVSDFGLSKMGTTTMSQTHISTVVKGSFGYLDPEYYRRHQLTEKSDVYSFGVVLCELLCARPALIRSVEKKQMSLAEWTKSCHRHDTISQIIDPHLRGKITAPCLNKFVELAVSCMSDNGNERPSMNDVVWGLEFALQLQQSGEAMSSFNAEKNNEDEVAFMKGNDTGISCSSWEYSSDSKDSRNTKSSSEVNSTTNESIKGMSGTVFSEIRDPSMR